jgi:hypothetical protein
MSSSSNSSLISPTISSITSSKDTRPEVPHHQQQLNDFSYFENPLTNYLTFIFRAQKRLISNQSKSSLFKCGNKSLTKEYLQFGLCYRR